VTASRVQWRDVNGVVLLDKPSGITSHTAVQKVRRLYSAAKGGHTGTLDPLATGLLPVCLGEATKFAHLLLEADKTYLATIRFGITTTTGDLEGEITARQPVIAPRERVVETLGEFVGDILQTPPMYSAIKQDGQPLYKLARAGHDVPRAPRQIAIHSLELLGLSEAEANVRVVCSKGTYIRVLAEDIGGRLGCGACLAALRREAVGGLQLSSACTLGQLEELPMAGREALLLPPDALVSTLPRFDLDAPCTRRLSQGQPVDHAAAGKTGLARIYGPDREFLGIAEVTGQGRIVPKRLTARG